MGEIVNLCFNLMTQIFAHHFYVNMLAEKMQTSLNYFYILLKEQMKIKYSVTAPFPPIPHKKWKLQENRDFVCFIHCRIPCV